MEPLPVLAGAFDFRYTHIKSFDGRDIFVPNGMLLQEPVEHYTRDGFYRFGFVVGIDYDDDIDGATEVILSAVQEQQQVVNDADHYPFAVTEELAVSTVNLKAFFWVDTKDYRKGVLETRGRVMRNVKNAYWPQATAFQPIFRSLNFMVERPFLFARKMVNTNRTVMQQASNSNNHNSVITS